MSYTIIIPTMWYHTKQLLSMMVAEYIPNDLIEEIIIIDNRPTHACDSCALLNKVRIISEGKNIFVNPAWNKGVKEAKTEKVLILNDDITIWHFDKVLAVIEKHLGRWQIIGAHPRCFEQQGLYEGEIEIVPALREMEYGFGVMMAVYKESYYSIPDELKVWCGDGLQFHHLDPYLIKGFQIITEMRGTSKELNLRGVNQQELGFYHKYLKKWIL